MRHTLLYLFTTILVFLLIPLNICAQRNAAYEQYIEQYHKMATDQMKRYNIPASITLAQGLLESDAGRSDLARRANNHFGIKAGRDWTGKYIIKSDDRPNDRFRVYRSASESYEDHSRFLLKPRYASLFRLSHSDYKGWAHGLKAAGYATNPRYANLLINIIENYDLARYDRGTSDRHNETKQEREQSQAMLSGYTPSLCNDIVFIRARKGDTFKSIGKAMGISRRSIRKYNELPKDYTLQEGQILYLDKKKSHVAKPLRKTYHTVQAGESMYSISQLYGIKMKYLYKWNKLPNDYCPTPGARLLLK